jgi:lambda repressor-like predicted transcriptional regulator
VFTMRATRPPYAPEFRAEAVQFVKDSGKSMFQIAGDLGISYETLRTRVRKSFDKSCTPFRRCLAAALDPRTRQTLQDYRPDHSPLALHRQTRITHRRWTGSTHSRPRCRLTRVTLLTE